MPLAARSFATFARASATEELAEEPSTPPFKEGRLGRSKMHVAKYPMVLGSTCEIRQPFTESLFSSACHTSTAVSPSLGSPTVCTAYS
eukprot:scaffold21801_cov72-Phaeocystis_antarctica.AAC.4